MWPVFILTSAVSIIAVGFVIWPLFRRKPVAIPQEDGAALTELLTRKDTTLQAILELEFDHSVGKIEEADFAYFNQILRARAVALLQQIEQYAPQTAQLDGALEEEIAAKRRVW
jgi:Tfp pilus assembly protein PilN